MTCAPPRQSELDAGIHTIEEGRYIKYNAKSIHTYNAYNVIMAAVKRIPVTEPVWKDLAEMRSAGQTYAELLAEMIEDRKRRRLEEDVGKWRRRKKEDFVSLSEIKD